MNLADAFAKHARSRPDHPAVEDGERVVTYAELEALANTIAANLLTEDIEPGDIVGLALPDSIEHVAILWALASIGAVIFPIHTQLLRSEREVGLGGQQLKAVIVEGDASNLPSGTRIIPLERICVQSPEVTMPATSPALGADHPLRCVQSSGTTGTPKTFLLSHGQVEKSLLCYEKYANWTWQDRYASIIVMGLAWGCSACLAALYLGATIIINRTHTVEAVVDLLQEKWITVTALTPSHVRHLLAHAEDKPLLFPLMQSMLVGSSPMTPRERNLAREHLTPNFIEFYGTNELTLITFATPADQDAHPDSVGRLGETVEAQIVDADDRPLPDGSVGLIRFRSDRAATSYLNAPEATALAFRDGWFYPMDLAAIDEDGYIFLKGRADDLISCDGIKFYPIEVENVLLSHTNVSEAAVFGWPHDLHGQVAAAAVVTSAPVSYEDLATFCRSHLADYKIPGTILFVPRMPRNPMGKILKTELKDRLRQELAKRS